MVSPNFDCDKYIVVTFMTLDWLCCRLREVTEGKRPVPEQKMADVIPDNIDMDPVVRLAVQSGVQASLADGDCSARRKRKRPQMNGSIDDVADVKERNECSSESCEDNIRSKKRKKLARSEQAVGVTIESRKRRHKTVVDSEPAAATADSDSKSAMEDEVEIWIPNRKYKGPLTDVCAKLAGEGSRKMKHHSCKKDDSSPFMTFIPVDKTPAALVRRRSKLSHSEPKELHKSVSLV